MSEKIDCRNEFYLGDWYVHPPTGSLTRDDVVSRLEPKIMEVLVLLAENYPAVVRKDVFFNTVWSDVNVVEHVLPRAISEIRRELGDDPREPRIIETYAKIGYRLITPPSSQAPTRADAAFTPRPTRGFSNMASFVGGMLTVAAIVTGILVLSGQSHQH